MTSRAKMPDVDKSSSIGITVGDTDGDTVKKPSYVEIIDFPIFLILVRVTKKCLFH